MTEPNIEETVGGEGDVAESLEEMAEVQDTFREDVNEGIGMLFDEVVVMRSALAEAIRRILELEAKVGISQS